MYTRILTECHLRKHYYYYSVTVLAVFMGTANHHSNNFWSGCGTAAHRRLSLYFQYYYFIQLVVAVTTAPQPPPQLYGVALTVKKRAFLCARVPQTIVETPFVKIISVCLSIGDNSFVGWGLGIYRVVRKKLYNTSTKNDLL